VCITIACGAISGFHATIASGTTPKMIDSERDIPMIGYGAMLVEAFVGILALIAATAMFTNDYFAINATAQGWKNLGLNVIDLPHLEREIRETLMHRPGGAVSLAAGMAFVFDRIPGLGGAMKYWYHFAIMFEALFILTTIDAGTRVARYVLGEILGGFCRPFSVTGWIPGTIICSAAVSFFWGYILYEGQISSIWPMFGVANQLLAAIALAIGTTLILKKGKKIYGLLTLVPFCYLALTVIWAGIENITRSYIPQKNVVCGLLTGVMLLLAAIIIVDSAVKWYGLVRNRRGEDQIEKCKL
jgi:carbon starvation protein